MRLNKKGFVVSTLMYTILIVFLFLIVGIITLLANRKMILDKLKKDVKDEINEMSKYDYFDETTVIYYNPVTGKICGNYTEDNSTSSAKTGCLKWYVFDDSNNSNKIKLILDHNTSYSVSKSNINSELDKLTTKSNWVNKPRLITADEVASITENTNFDSDSTGSWYYLENNSQTNPALKTNFSYTGNQQTYTASSDGLYNIKAWGAQGGTSGSYAGGKGAYTSGTIELKNNESLYVYVGGQGGQNATITNTGGYNGGGYSGNNGGAQSYGGGGATDIRVTSGTWNNASSLASRIMVAAGGGGGTAGTATTAGAGGALTGLSGTSANSTYNTATYLPLGGSQIAGGFGYQNSTARNGQWGMGVQTNSGGWGGGGGAGYYGGGNGHGTTGAGGSSFISGYLGCVAITSASSTSPKSGCANGTNDINCSYHYSNKKFINPVMIAGNTSMPTHSGESTMTGNSGNGYASITRVSDNAWLYDYTNNCESYGCIKNNNSTYGYWTSTGLWVVDSFGHIISAKDTSTEFGIRPVIEIFKPNADKSEDVTEFAYTGKQQQFIVPKTGYYKIELWGAQGGSTTNAVGGNGSYTSGIISLQKKENLYINVGGSGKQAQTAVTGSTPAGGFNGGGNGYVSRNTCTQQAASGGGATDVRLEGGAWNSATSLNSRIMIAAGGGGAFQESCSTSDNCIIHGGIGGALEGLTATYVSYAGFSSINPTGGTQTSGGKSVDEWTATSYSTTYSGKVGSGGTGTSSYSGGGSGYYGGASGKWQPGAGGSSFISGYAGVNAITSNSDRTHTNNIKHYSGKYFIDGVMTAGANEGNGHAKITYVGASLERPKYTDKYQKLEYIQSTGTQYIDTGLKFNTNVDSFELNYQTNDATGNYFLAGSGYSESGKIWVYSYKGGNTISTYITDTSGSQRTFKGITGPDTLKHKLVLYAKKFYVDDVLTSDNSSFTFGNTPTTFTLFNAQNSTNNTAYMAKTRIYSFKMWKNGKLVRDMIPVKRKSDNVLGLYDKVEGKFYTNAGTGTFTAGPVIDLNNVRYIKDCTSGSSVNASNHWVELQAIKDGVNIAKGKTATGITNNTNFPISRITDGDLTSANYAEGGSASPVCITIDLGSTYNLDEIAVWHYWADGRTYTNHNLNVSSDNSTWKTVISSTEKETSNGKRVNAWN